MTTRSFRSAHPPRARGRTRSATSGHLARGLGRVLVASIAALAVLLATPTGAGAQDSDDDIVITGRGWGHGRGLGQYGAYGYAQERGWSSAQILDHFYGGTTAGAIPAATSVDPDRVRVDLRYMRGRATVVGLESGTLVMTDTAGTVVARESAGAVKLHPIAGGYEVQGGASCDGPWTTRGILSMETVRIRAESTAGGADGLVHVCGSRQRVWYEGEVAATKDNGSTRTVNTVTIDQYLRGVVPNEMPALWPQAALEAQAVAARSYAMAGDTRQQPYADTCDTIRCQVYDGAYVERSGSFRSAHHPRTDAAIAATSDVVRLRADGSVARTEFSSSTGGYTAGGDFPAVVDAGDSIAANPNHRWEVRIPRSSIENRYGLGRLRSAEVASSNGLGPDGGRVTNVRFDFERGIVFESGDRLRQILGLKSNWFSFGSGSGAELRTTAEGRFIDQAYQRLGGRAATNAELVAWQGPVGAGQRSALTQPLARDRHFTGLLIDDLYRASFDRPADAAGRAHWRSAVADGLGIESLGVLFLGSDECYARSGGTDRAYVAALYRSVLDREPDRAGLDYWADALGEGRAGRLDVAAGFHASPESRHLRVDRLYRRLLGTSAPPEVSAVLADQLRSVDERVLAGQIAASSTAYAAWTS